MYLRNVYINTVLELSELSSIFSLFCNLLLNVLIDKYIGNFEAPKNFYFLYANFDQFLYIFDIYNLFMNDILNPKF
jgi:hypothetical protein